MRRFIHGAVLVTALTALTLGVRPVYAQFDVAAYYPAWRQWALPAEEIDYSTVTELRHAFGWPDLFGNLEVDEGMPYEDLIAYASASNVPVLLSLGGASHSTFFPTTLASGQLRATFISDIVDFCSSNGYSGVDIDWEFPESASDRLHLTDFVQELRAAFDAIDPDWRITMAVPAGSYLQLFFDLEGMAPYVDRFSVMTYDFNGWNEIAGHNAPLWSDDLSDCDNGSVEGTIDGMLQSGNLPASKLHLGLPFYGRRYEAEWLCDSTDVAEYTIYEDIVPLMNQGWQRVWDDAAGVPLVRSPGLTEFVSYDDSTSIADKVAFAEDRELAGVMIWALGIDRVGERQVLMEAVAHNLGVTGFDRVALPETASLAPPRPNPFNDATVVGFTLPAPERIRVDVINLQGQVVDQLVQGVWAAGWHEIAWRPARLASGVYFIVMRGERSAPVTRKAVYLR